MMKLFLNGEERAVHITDVSGVPRVGDRCYMVDKQDNSSCYEVRRVDWVYDEESGCLVVEVTAAGMSEPLAPLAPSGME